MAFEVYFVAAVALAALFLIVGWRAETALGRSFLLWGGLIFVLLGITMEVDGIDREVNWRTFRDPLDQNRITDINVTTIKFLPSVATTPPPAGVQFDSSLFIIQQVFLYILGAIMAAWGLYSFALMGWEQGVRDLVRKRRD